MSTPAMPAPAVLPRVLLRRFPGLTDYAAAVAAMTAFTDGRDAGTADEVWCLEHRPVYTLGLNANPAHVLSPGDIPVIRTDRGGQVTYHGPGQLVVYVLLDLARARLGVRAVVSALEQAVVRAAGAAGIAAAARRDAPGVYVEGAKLASVGLRVRRGSTYHGLAVNVAMDLGPFRGINPCGYPDLGVTQFADFGVPVAIDALARDIAIDVLAELKLPAAPGFLPPASPGATPRRPAVN